MVIGNEATRFKKGEINNPKGRPPGKTGPQMRTVLKRLLENKVVMNGEEITGTQAVAQALIACGASGEVPAIKEIFDRIDGKVSQPVDMTQHAPREPDVEMLKEYTLIEGIKDDKH